MRQENQKLVVRNKQLEQEVSKLGVINIFFQKLEVDLRKLEFGNKSSEAITFHSSDTIDNLKLGIQVIHKVVT